jgi:hypothetical protein
MKVEVYRLVENAKLPEKSTEGSVGDVSATMGNGSGETVERKNVI